MMSDEDEVVGSDFIGSDDEEKTVEALEKKLQNILQDKEKLERQTKKEELLARIRQAETEVSNLQTTLTPPKHEIDKWTADDLHKFFKRKGMIVTNKPMKELRMLAKAVYDAKIQDHKSEIPSGVERRTINCDNGRLTFPSVTDTTLSNWSEDLASFPSIEHSDTHTYLLSSADFDLNRLKNMKKENGFALFKSNCLKNLKTHNLDKGYDYVMGECWSATNDKKNLVVSWSLIQDGGRIHSAGCSCTSDTGCCDHVIGLLLSLATSNKTNDYNVVKKKVGQVENSTQTDQCHGHIYNQITTRHVVKTKQTETSSRGLQEIELETSLNEPSKYSDENNEEPEIWIPPVVKTVNLNNQIEKDLFGKTSESATLTSKKAGDGQQYTQKRTDVFSKANSTALKQKSESVSSTKVINQAATDQKLHLEITEIKKEIQNNDATSPVQQPKVCSGENAKPADVAVVNLMNSNIISFLKTNSKLSSSPGIPSEQNLSDNLRLQQRQDKDSFQTKCCTTLDFNNTSNSKDTTSIGNYKDLMPTKLTEKETLKKTVGIKPIISAPKPKVNNFVTTKEKNLSTSNQKTTQLSNTSNLQSFSQHLLKNSQSRPLETDPERDCSLPKHQQPTQQSLLQSGTPQQIPPANYYFNQQQPLSTLVSPQEPSITALKQRVLTGDSHLVSPKLPQFSAEAKQPISSASYPQYVSYMYTTESSMQQMQQQHIRSEAAVSQPMDQMSQPLSSYQMLKYPYHEDTTESGTKQTSSYFRRSHDNPLSPSQTTVQGGFKNTEQTLTGKDSNPRVDKSGTGNPSDTSLTSRLAFNLQTEPKAYSSGAENVSIISQSSKLVYPCSNTSTPYIPKLVYPSTSTEPDIFASYSKEGSIENDDKKTSKINEGKLRNSGPSVSISKQDDLTNRIRGSVVAVEEKNSSCGSTIETMAKPKLSRKDRFGKQTYQEPIIQQTTDTFSKGNEMRRNIISYDRKFLMKLQKSVFSKRKPDIDHIPEILVDNEQEDAIVTDRSFRLTPGYIKHVKPKVVRDKQIKPRQDRSTENAKEIVERSAATTEQKDMTTEEVMRKAISAFNMLKHGCETDMVVRVISELPVTNEDSLCRLVNLVVETVVEDPGLTSVCTSVCSKLARVKVPSRDTPTEIISFSTAYKQKVEREIRNAIPPTEHQQRRIEEIVRFTGCISRLVLLKLCDIHTIIMDLAEVGSEHCLGCFCMLLGDVWDRMAKCTSTNYIQAYLEVINNNLERDLQSTIKYKLHQLKNRRN